MSEPAQGGARMLGIDAARGMAMFFSCLAHFAWWMEPATHQAFNVLSNIGKVATPTFLLLSGTMTAWLCASAGRDPARTRYKLLNRALFLLTLGHLLISMTEAHRDGGFRRTVAEATILDDIGLCMLLCVLLFQHLRDPRFRQKLAWFGAGGYAVCWLVVLCWHPVDPALVAIHQALLSWDPSGTPTPGYSSPSLQYACLFAIGLGTSDVLIAAATRAAAEPWRLRRLLQLGCVFVATALAMRGIRWFVDRSMADTTIRHALDVTFTIEGKMPPSPGYVLFFGGVGLILSTLLFSAAVSRRRWLKATPTVLAVVGRASLFVFILQYFVFWTVPDLAGIRAGQFAWAVFPLGLIVVWVAAWSWNRIRGNRFLTLGIGSNVLAARHGRRPSSGRGAAP